MKEDFLHYVWRYLKFNTKNLRTVCGQKILVLHNGLYLEQEGPDFFNAKIQIGEHLWAGNVELHIKSSDWFAHKHQFDSNYANVILHVVWEYDKPVALNKQTSIPTLELKNIIDLDLLQKYQEYFKSKNSLLCTDYVGASNKIKNQLYQSELLISKLNEGTFEVEEHLIKNKNHWEEVLLHRLFAYFGTKINKESFSKSIGNIPYRVLQSERNNEKAILALLYGQSGLLPVECKDDFSHELYLIYQHQKHKYQLEESCFPVQFFKTRPDNFPTIRIAQFAHLVSRHKSLFFELEGINKLSDYYDFFYSIACSYWDDKYSFGKISLKVYPKQMSKKFIDVLLINAVFPVLYTYHKNNNPDVLDRIIGFYEQIPFENNHVVRQFPLTNFRKKNAADSQSLLYLHKKKCLTKKCLQCKVGVQLMA